MPNAALDPTQTYCLFCTQLVHALRRPRASKVHLVGLPRLNHASITMHPHLASNDGDAVGSLHGRTQDLSTRSKLGHVVMFVTPFKTWFTSWNGTIGMCLCKLTLAEYKFGGFQKGTYD